MKDSVEEFLSKAESWLLGDDQPFVIELLALVRVYREANTFACRAPGFADHRIGQVAEQAEAKARKIVGGNG